MAIFDVGTGDLPYLVTELVEGETLRERIARGPLPQAEAVSISLQIAAGLGAAHARGVVHRDLKPDNVIVTADGRAKILDFGLATTVSTQAESDGDLTVAQTLPGLMLGTLGYMAPEQARAADRSSRRHLRLWHRAVRDGHRPTRPPRRFAGRHDRVNLAPRTEASADDQAQTG